MAEQITETLLTEKLETSSWSRKTTIDNFVTDGEITVTITLSEYRSLVASNATKIVDIEKAEKDKYERDSENSKLRARVRDLEKLVFEYRKQFGELEVSEVENG